jgi:hypothetical protein
MIRQLPPKNPNFPKFCHSLMMVRIWNLFHVWQYPHPALFQAILYMDHLQTIHTVLCTESYTHLRIWLFAHHSPKASAVLSSLMFPVAGRILCWLSRMLSYFKTFHALQKDGCMYRYGIICLHIYCWHGNIIPYLYVQLSSWRCTLGFETCRRYKN